MTMHRGACGLSGMASLEEASVGLLFCDLPSGQTQAPFDQPIDLDRFWEYARRICRQRTAIVLMASHMRFAADVVASNPQWFRYDLVWKKNKPTGFLNANRMPLRNHEFLLVFYRKAPRYHPQMRETGRPMHAATQTGHGSNYGKKTQRVRTQAGSTLRHPWSVLEFPIMNNDDPQKTHPQQKPQALLRWVVSSYSAPDDLVVDPCAGSGSMGDACEALGRRFAGWEITP